MGSPDPAQDRYKVCIGFRAELRAAPQPWARTVVRRRSAGFVLETESTSSSVPCAGGINRGQRGPRCSGLLLREPALLRTAHVELPWHSWRGDARWLWPGHIRASLPQGPEGRAE